MRRLFAIGTLGTLFAVAFLLLRRPKAPRVPKVRIRIPEGFLELTEAEAASREAYLKEREAWLVEHTDPLFGRPVDTATDLYFNRARRSWDTQNILNEYHAPFRFKEDGYVEVTTDEFPLLDQKFIFEWMTEHMNEISGAVPRLLLQSPNDGISNEEAATAFSPHRVTEIIFQGSQPVVWRMLFDTELGEGEAFRGEIRGKDQTIESAALFM